MGNCGVLDGVRVLDLTRVLAGPYSGMILADMGAEVVKLEVPGHGDDSRGFTPMINGESAYFMNLNRNKKSIVINLKEEAGRSIFKELIKEFDILLENFRPGTMEKLGLGYDDLKKIHPGLIYGAVSGFGHYGPYAKRPGYDIIGQGMGGLMSTTGWPDGEPTRSGTAIADVLAGLNMTIGILAAYSNKLQNGHGDKVDVALVDSVVSGMEIITQIYFATGKDPERIGNRYESVYPYDTFKAKDKTFIIGAGNNKLFALLTDYMGRNDLLEDPRFKENADRVKNHAALKPIIEEWAKDKSADDIINDLLKKGCPAAPVNKVSDITKDPHIAGAREMFVEVDHPKAGKTTLTGCHIKFSETECKINTPAPELGQHTHEFLKTYLGYDEAKLTELKAKGIIEG
ncbi:crotonobetainyl-CoA:carnitine CoA-transferase CaiB-like acyl-CoA transferase [Anaerospora hongkongensis]|uniref:Crotonobetainyl-CoA:carnitine CoA-transferase CaiB-like acyl-CoA transferase n=1 Tax=Anaerospora hongkongensis TaxID=244830 RepID=A0A4R1Q482_9FIRM|nr:CoA transferase [Anaerospora hongkongensis]TCL39874.1 crotonobetainyl-CoA:carnitine CoA-transferase CaiB-like acyl-CoA transferase [Anaerospora hongkongensis]